MNAHHPGRFDHHTAEDMLRGRRVQGVDGTLSDLLGAAAAPAPDGELPGERAALAAFRTARGATAAQPEQGRGGWGALRRHRLKLITAAIAAAMGLAGTAAAVTGTLPIGFHGSPPGSGTSGQHLSTTTPPTQPTDSNGGSASIQQLCQRYNDSSESDRRNMLADPAFGPLIRAAGGSQNVPGYCARLSTSDKTKRRPDTGGDSGHPAAPSGRQQGNQPSSQPSSQSSAPPR